MSEAAIALKVDPIESPEAAVSRLHIGRIVAVSGSQAIVLLEYDRSGETNSHSPDMGQLVKVYTGAGAAMGIVSAVSVPIPSESRDEPEIRTAEIELVGEIDYAENGLPCRFRRGISRFPSLGDRVSPAAPIDLEYVFSCNTQTTVRIGTLHQDSSISACVLTEELLGKHFAVLGTTGTGKSCAIALLLRGILTKLPNAHIVLLDPHNEYRSCFGDSAEYISPENLQLPYWLLNFEEIVEVLVGHESEHAAEEEILRELIPQAKASYRGGESTAQVGPLYKKPLTVETWSVDSPRPYRLSDVISLLDQIMGKLERPENLSPYRRLKARIESLAADPRYAFMFGRLTAADTMVKVLGRLFRIPVNGKPVSLVDLSGIPSEILNVVVSVICRLAFDLALWSDSKVPITIVCEEAHRYAPRDPSLGFEPTKRALSRIAKEGRKYGVSLGVVTQRPSELATTILSQCNTVFALRLTNENDKSFVGSATADSTPSLLQFLPSMGNGEALAFGEGVNLPMRVVFDRLPGNALPRGAKTLFSATWSNDIDTDDFLDSVVHRWRHNQRE